MPFDFMLIFKSCCDAPANALGLLLLLIRREPVLVLLVLLPSTACAAGHDIHHIRYHVAQTTVLNMSA
jgi:hypothetical protein